MVDQTRSMPDQFELDMSLVIPNKLARVKKVENKCAIHKYRRFSLKNKTYRTDLYYCATCGHTVKIELIFGRLTKCWKCNESFNMKAGDTSIYPKCEDCRKSSGKEVITSTRPDIELDFLESSEVEKPEKSDKGTELLKELGLI